MFVERFIAWAESASADDRAEAIAEVSRTFIDTETSESDRAACIRIFTLFLKDPSTRVRAAMARDLATGTNVPRALLWNLANDLPEVSSALFEHSALLCEDTLLDAIGSGCEATQRAIAKRVGLQGNVVRKLVQEATAPAIICLLDNRSLMLGPNLKHDIAERLGMNACVRGNLLGCDDLKPHTRQLLVSHLSHAMSDLVEQKGWVETSRMTRTLNDAVNRASVDVAMETDSEDMKIYVDQLRASGQLTPALLLRSICAGNAVFFETALVQLSGSSKSRVQSIVDEGRPSAFKALYKRTGLPVSAYPAFAAAVSVWQELGAAPVNNETTEAMLCERAVTDILSRIESLKTVDASLLSMLRRLSAEASLDCAMAGPSQKLLTAA